MDLKVYIWEIYRVLIKYRVFSKDFRIFRTWSFSVFPWVQCVYTHQAGRTPTLQQNWQSSEKSQHFREKTQYLMNTLYLYLHINFSVRTSIHLLTNPSTRPNHPPIHTSTNQSIRQPIHPSICFICQ